MNIKIILSIKLSPADTIELRQVPRSIIDSLKKDDAFWYVDHVFDKKEAKEKNYRSSETSITMDEHDNTPGDRAAFPRYTGLVSCAK